MNTTLGISLVAITVLALVLSPSLPSISAAGHEVMSPRQQMKAGVDAEDVECKEGLVLMIRATNGAPACVKESTSMKLSTAGWGTVIEQEEEAMMEEEEHMDDGSMEIKEEEEMMMDDTSEESMDEMMEEGTEKQIELEEGLSMGEQEGELPPETPEEEPFSIGGIDLSMAAPVEGEEDAPLTIIEFGDYQCPNCKDWFNQEKPKIDANYISSGIAKLYFIDFTFLGDDSITAAQGAYCAGEQGMYHEFHSILYSNQGDIEAGWANNDAVKQFAVDLELDSEAFDSCLDESTFEDRVAYNTDVGAENGVTGTPHFFIVSPEGEIKQIAGPQPSVVFDAAILSLGYGP